MIGREYRVVSCEELGASPGFPAAVNTRAIQTALDRLGHVQLSRPGVYEINDTLVIKSETTLEFGAGVSLKLASGSNCLMLTNEAYNLARAGSASTSITVSWTAGVVATVTWTAHGKTSKDYVLIQGASQNVFNGVFAVHEVLTADTFTVILPFSAVTTATGTILGYSCDKNISLKNISLDYNYAENPSASAGSERHACVLGLIGNGSVSGLFGQNVYKYVFNTVADMDCRYENIRGNNCSDILKIYGPTRNCVTQGVYGNANDDCLTLQAKEPAAFAAYQPFFGNIHERVIRDVRVHTNSSGASSGGVVIYASDDEILEGITLDNIECHSDTGAGISVKYGDTYSTGKINTLRIVNFRPSCTTVSTKYALAISAKVDVLEIDGIRPRHQDNTTQMIRQESTSTIRSLSIKNLYYNNTGWPSGTATYLVNLNGAADTVSFEDCFVAVSAASGRFITIGSGALYNLVFNRFVMESGSQFLIQQAGASVERSITIRSSRIKSVTTGLDLRSACRVSLENSVFDTLSNGVIRPSTTSGVMAKVFGYGNSFTSATPLTPQSPSTVEVYSWDIRIDPVAVANLATTAGQFCWSTQAGAEGGPCVRVSGGWYALASGTSGANQVIT